MIKVYDNILKLRKSKGLSQLDVSEKLGINQDTYSKLERGKIQLTIERLHQISEILGVSVDDILHYKEDTLTKADLEIKVRYLETQNKLLEQMLINQATLININDNTRHGGLLHEQYKDLREEIRQKENLPQKSNNAEDLITRRNIELEISRKAFRELLNIHPMLEQALEHGLISESWITGLWILINSK
jgi:transcriptional regulator with XRE-family HTH domain